MIYFNEPIVSVRGTIKIEVDEVALKNELRRQTAGSDFQNLGRGSVNAAFLICHTGMADPTADSCHHDSV